MSSPCPNPTLDALSRAEFDEFLQLFTHELRNRLNGIALEAADLAEQVGDTADASRLQERVRDCAELLKTVREMVTPEAPQVKPLSVAEAMAKLRGR
jgi:signal transduction histidine kinase